MCDECNTGEAVVIQTHLNLFNGDKDFNKNHWGVKIYFKKKRVVLIDKCLVALIEDLNRNSFPTIFSCCGHGMLNPYILLYVRDKQDEDRVVDIARSYWGNKNYNIETNNIIWKHFDGYYPIYMSYK